MPRSGPREEPRRPGPWTPGPSSVSRDVVEVSAEPVPPYRDLLEAARLLGYSDGRWALRAELVDPPGMPPPSCGGRSPEEFARLLWGRRPGAPPSGLELNAPLWYADGFAEALVAERARADRRREAHVWSCVRALAVPRGRG